MEERILFCVFSLSILIVIFPQSLWDLYEVKDIRIALLTRYVFLNHIFCLIGLSDAHCGFLLHIAKPQWISDVPHIEIFKTFNELEMYLDKLFSDGWYIIYDWYVCIMINELGVLCHLSRQLLMELFDCGKIL